MSADRIMALADSGTPGPWWGGSSTRRKDGYGILGAERDRGTGAAGCIAVFAMPDVPRRRADVAKVVAAVNALPKVAALVAATQAHANGVCGNTYRHDCPGCCSVCGDLWPCPTAVARDELVAALGVDSE